MLVRTYEFLQRKSSEELFRRPASCNLSSPVVSFAFDDFPESAVSQGATILEEFGGRGTFYVCFDLLGKNAPVGPIAKVKDVLKIVERGHELGCHTFTHCHAWKTSPERFEESIEDNEKALQQVIPGYHFQTHSFPISSPHPLIKRRVEKHFAACRGGGQRINNKQVDLNRLNSFFIEKARGDESIIQRLIEKTVRERGWLILSTHDVCSEPTRFGCTGQLFRSVVAFAVQAGLRILPVANVIEEISE